MKEPLIDVAVLIIFFCRNEQFEKVFEQVKQARPKKLYLYQDGPRLGRETDIIGIQKCREIVADAQIDWECEVHRLYQEKNYGCDPSEFIAQKWMFSHEEMGIILEDDDVPSQSFFPFCKELLSKYKDNVQINMICGMNNTGVSKHIEDSYLFTKKGSIWGWASWRRVLDTWDGTYSWLDDEKAKGKIRSQMSKREYESFIKTSEAHKATGREHYESINAAAMYMNDSLNIVPRYNMISNIGVVQESTHSVGDIRLLPQKIQNLFYMKTYEIDFPLIHPDKIIRDMVFEKEMSFTQIDLMCMRFERIIRMFRYMGVKQAFAYIFERIFCRKR